MKMKRRRILGMVMVALSIFVLTTIVVLADDKTTTAGTGKTVFSAASQMMDAAKTFIIGISTASLVVAEGIGMIMKHFSGGDPQKVGQANHLMKGAIISWAVVNGATLITSTISPYLQ